MVAGDLCSSQAVGKRRGEEAEPRPPCVLLPAAARAQDAPPLFLVPCLRRNVPSRFYDVLEVSSTVSGHCVISNLFSVMFVYFEFFYLYFVMRCTKRTKKEKENRRKEKKRKRK